MKKIVFSFCVLFLFINNIIAQIPRKELIDNFLQKDSVVILVTDSGLGGLSVASDLYERFKSFKIFKNANIIFFNVQPHLNYGYNQMKSTKEKAWVFNNALNKLYEKYKPDIILIACNTLSVIYEYTDFYKTTTIPVLGIIETGVDIIKAKLDQSNNSQVIIFATETTVSEGKHASELVRLGINRDKIIAVPCPRLAGSIERDFQSMVTDSLVTAYINEAANKLNNNKNEVIVSYNCTHYGYIDNLFRKKFDERGIKAIDFLDPNPYLIDFIFDEKIQNRFSETNVDLKVYSQAELTPEKISSIYTLIEKTSPESADALLYYDLLPDFFNWKYEEQK